MDRYTAKDAGQPVKLSLRQARFDTWTIHQLHTPKGANRDASTGWSHDAVALRKVAMAEPECRVRLRHRPRFCLPSQVHACVLAKAG